MEAFAASELTPAKRKDYTADEALCLFGQSSPLRGEACARTGLRPKSGLDPTGKVDRGSFTRCKNEWNKDAKGQWVSSWNCSG